MTTTIDINGTPILDQTSGLQDDDAATSGISWPPRDSEPCAQPRLR
ncbi:MULTISPECIES: hypothetical protein [unclassified Mesorhizobium]|nr:MULTISPECIES: hypothetical protein [unclassified Mesorhizobium]